MKRTILITMMTMLASMGSMAQGKAPMVVSTESGLVKGIDQEGSMAFLGGSQIMRANIVFYSILTFPLSVFEYEMLKRAYAPSSNVFL